MVLNMHSSLIGWFVGLFVGRKHVGSLKWRKNDRRQTEGFSKIRTPLKWFELTKNSHEVRLPRDSEDTSKLRMRTHVCVTDEYVGD